MPPFTISGRTFDFINTEYQVVEVNRISETVLESSGGGEVFLYNSIGGTRGTISSPTITSRTEKYKMVWIKGADDKEMEIRVDEYFQVRAGHKLIFTYVVDVKSGDAHYVGMRNETTNVVEQFVQLHDIVKKICSGSFVESKYKMENTTRAIVFAVSVVISLVFVIAVGLFLAMGMRIDIPGFPFVYIAALVVSPVFYFIIHSVMANSYGSKMKRNFISDCTFVFKQNAMYYS